MINKFLLNKILLSWGDEDGSKQTDSNIIKAGNIAAALSPYTIKCIYDELSKGVKIIDLSTIERNIKLHKIKATVPQMLNIYINGEKLDMNKDISPVGQIRIGCSCYNYKAQALYLSVNLGARVKHIMIGSEYDIDINEVSNIGYFMGKIGFMF